MSSGPTVLLSLPLTAIVVPEALLALHIPHWLQFQLTFGFSCSVRAQLDDVPVFLLFSLPV